MHKEPQMSTNTTPNSGPVSPFDSADNLAKRAEATLALGTLAPTVLDFLAKRSDTIAPLASVVLDLRLTFPYTGKDATRIGTADVLADSQATKQAIAELFKSNNLPSNADDGSFHSLLRYYIGKEIDSRNIRPVKPEVSPESEAAAKQDRVAKFLDSQVPSVLVDSIVRRSEKTGDVKLGLSAALDTIVRIDPKTMPINQRNEVGQMLAHIVAAAQVHLTELGFSVEAAA